MKTMKTAHREKLKLLAVIGTGVSITLPGCYTRTVESRGLGTRYQGGEIHSPNLKTKSGGGLLDGAGDLLIGPRTIEERRR